MASLEPATSARHGAVKRSHEDDADNGFEGSSRKFLGTRDEVSGGVVDEDVESAFTPDGVDHCLDCVGIANVAGNGVDRTFCSGREFGCGFLQNFLATAADVDDGSQFEEAMSHGSAEPGSTTGDKDALPGEKIVAEHSWNITQGVVSKARLGIRTI